jgi:hypothetical protein
MARSTRSRLSAIVMAFLILARKEADTNNLKLGKSEGVVDEEGRLRAGAHKRIFRQWQS